MLQTGAGASIYRMKKIIGIIIILLALVGVTSFLFRTTPSSPQVVPTTNTSSVTPTALSPTIAKPITIEIPSIRVHASVEYVGLDAKKNMDVPKDPDNVAWYELGFVPGMNGNAVIAGHLDTKTSPAVFANLAKIKIGEEVIIHTQDGEKQLFTVEKIQQYPFDDFPLKEVFGDSKEKRLNLITCTGAFDFGSENYSHRTVVYTKKIE